MTVIYASIYASDLPVLETTLKRKDIFHIVVPHQVDKANVDYLRNKIGSPSYLWTHFDAQSSANILVVDAIGHLFDLYAYADLVYVGGGFQKGVHNTLEPAVFGLPIAFGPRHQGFVETRAFLESGIATAIHKTTDFEQFIKQNQSKEIRKIISGKSSQYFQQNQGSLDHILAWIEQYYFKSRQKNDHNQV
ncbi:MAG: hypothetical protein IPN29_15990 [Saprospiraceae bacterium]|nr:hypothetical protein [Saprospiraceae bacterium]